MSLPSYIPHYTIAEYQQWEGDWELWEGVPVAMTPSSFGTHQKALARLSHMMISALDRGGCNDCDVVIELDWVVSDDTVVRPDLAIVCDATLDRYIDQVPALIVEVLSESTQAKDRTAKYTLYEHQGVGYYFLYDPIACKWELYRWNDGSFEPMSSASTLDIELHPGCRIQLDLTQM